MKKTVLASLSLVLGLIFVPENVQALTLYGEDFSGQNGKGATGGAATDVVGVDWSIELNDAALFDSKDYFRVEAEAFTARDTNAGCPNVRCTSGGNLNPLFPAWLSPEIDISGFTNLALSLDAFASDVSFEHEENSPIGEKDYFIVSYLLDDVEFLAADLITQSGLFTNQTVNQAIGDGSTLQVKVQLNTTASTELLSFDNILVTGDQINSSQSVPEPASIMGLIALAGVGIASRKRQSVGAGLGTNISKHNR
ncbi:PEP-CTERM sorting domain-containing protein [Coleofasciculus chthonoplastes]|uniref:PEP-CTERM sorting domain-containing protein n=1 Tax=Coleofasciculus chthonoplastes TaxID=64178 RepID=UPI0032F6D8B0